MDTITTDCCEAEVRADAQGDLRCLGCGAEIICRDCLDTGEVFAAHAPGGKGQCMTCGDVPDDYSERLWAMANPFRSPW